MDQELAFTTLPDGTWRDPGGTYDLGARLPARWTRRPGLEGIVPLLMGATLFGVVPASSIVFSGAPWPSLADGWSVYVILPFGAAFGLGALWMASIRERLVVSTTGVLREWRSGVRKRWWSWPIESYDAISMSVELLPGVRGDTPRYVVSLRPVAASGAPVVFAYAGPDRERAEARIRMLSAGLSLRVLEPGDA